MKIFLCGFSGAGKTTLLSELKGEKFLKDFAFIDLDNYIEQEYAEGLELGDFIRLNGMEYFRGLELEALKKLSKREHIIVALGGGALNEATINLLQSDWKGIFLNIDFETCWNRIQGDENRPLVMGGRGKLESLYEERFFYYNQFKSLKSRREVVNYLMMHVGKNS